MSDKILAVLCSDLHISHRPPVARSAEPNWYDTMSDYFSQLQQLAKKWGAPVICAGDVF